MEPRGPNAHGRAKVGVVQERNPAREARHAPDAYVFSNFYSNFWIIFGKRWEARSRLYRNESLQVNSRWKALDEIYKIYKLLHRSAFKNSAKFRQTFSHFYSFVFEISLIFRNFCPNLTNFDENFPEFQQICWKRSKSPRFSNFLRFRTENCWIF